MNPSIHGEAVTWGFCKHTSQCIVAASECRNNKQPLTNNKPWAVPGVLCASERSRRAAARVAHDEEVQSLARHWRRLHRNLTLDRGIWADTSAPQHYHWKLDKSEDSIRRLAALALRRLPCWKDLCFSLDGFFLLEGFLLLLQCSTCLTDLTSAVLVRTWSLAR